MGRWLLLSAVLTLVACGGERRPTGPPTTTGRDAGTSTTTVDGGTDRDAGPARDAGMRRYCGDQVCDANESCMTCMVDCGPCDCGHGFTLDRMQCVPDAPEPFRFRTTDAICRRWNEDWIANVGTEWEPSGIGNDPCDWGTVSDASRDNALLRTNLYRWLCGLDTVTENPALRDQEQACAVIMNAMGGLTHTPDMTAECWTQEGFDAASSSNLALAGGGLARSVDLYVGDQGVDSLGHRRWVLNPEMGRTTFGYKPPTSCMYAFDRSGSGRGDFVAYPPPGWVPIQAAPGRWSFASRLFPVVQNTTAQIDTGNGFEDVPSERLGGGFGGGPALAFDPPANLWTEGTVVRVAIRNTSNGDFLYTVAFFDCP